MSVVFLLRWCFKGMSKAYSKHDSKFYENGQLIVMRFFFMITFLLSGTLFCSIVGYFIMTLSFLIYYVNCYKVVSARLAWVTPRQRTLNYLSNVVCFCVFILSYVLNIPFMSPTGTFARTLGIVSDTKDPYYVCRDASLVLSVTTYLMSRRVESKIASSAPNKPKLDILESLFYDKEQFTKFLISQNLIKFDDKVKITKHKWRRFKNVSVFYMLSLVLALFIWLSVYITIESFFLIFWILHTLFGTSHYFYMKATKFVYFPLIFINFSVMYVSNMEGVVDHDCFDGRDICKYGVFTFEVPFLHFLLQYSIILFCFAIIYFDINIRQAVSYTVSHDEELEESTVSRFADELMLKLLEKAVQNKKNEEVKGLDHDNIEEETEKHETKKDKGKSQKNIKNPSSMTIFVDFCIYNLDVLLMFFLYFTGAFKIDVFHGLLMIIFVIFLMRTKWFRTKYAYLAIFIYTFVTIKYFYACTYDWYGKHLGNALEFLGLSSTIDYSNKYFKTNLFNSNWAIVILASLQYRLYESEYFKQRYNQAVMDQKKIIYEEQRPKLTKFFKGSKYLVDLGIPWIAMLVGVILSFFDRNSLINYFAYFGNSLILIIFYVYLNHKSPTQLYILTIAWLFGSILYIGGFALIYIYQFFLLDSVKSSIPDFIKDNQTTIGLLDFSDTDRWLLPIRFLAYAINFICTIIVRDKLGKIYKELRSHSNLSGEKFDFLDSTFAFFAKYCFTLLCLAIIAVSIHWRLSFSTMLYMALVWGYMVLLPFLRSGGLKKSEGLLNNHYRLDYLIEQAQKQDQRFTAKQLVARKWFNNMILFVTFISLNLIYASELINTIDKDLHEKQWKNLVFYSFFFGVNYTKNTENYSFFYQCLGYYIVLVLCILERKSQALLLEDFEQRQSFKYRQIEEEHRSEDAPRIKSKETNINQSFCESFDSLGSHSDVERESNQNLKRSLNNTDDIDPVSKINSLLTKKYTHIVRKGIRCLIYTFVVLSLAASIVTNSSVFGIVNFMIITLWFFIGLKNTPLKFLNAVI